MTSQTDIALALLDPAQPAPAGMVNPDGSPATKRFDIYRNNVAVGLTEALETGFPAVRKIVGDAFFRAMAGVYLRNHPPVSPLMMFYGAQMPGFLKGFEPVRGLAYLPDVARLELALRQAYHAADGAALPADALSRIAPDQLMRTRLKFAPAVQLLGSRFPFYSIWKANTDPDGSKITLQAESALITRPGFDPKVTGLAGPDARFVQSLLNGGALGSAMALGGEGCDVAGTLALLLAQNAIIGLE